MKQGSVSSIPYNEAEAIQRGGACVSTSLRSPTDSCNLPKATSATPASQHSSPFLSAESSSAEVAAAVVDDVFLSVGEVLSAQDSTRKEFHCAVLRALNKEPPVVEADQAPGTADEAESCSKSSLPFPPLPCSAFARVTTFRCAGRAENPCLLCPLLFWGFWSLLPLFYLIQVPPLPHPQISLISLWVLKLIKHSFCL